LILSDMYTVHTTK